MSIGIIGAGEIGQAFAKQVIKAGYEVLLSNSRGPESLAPLAAKLGGKSKAVTAQEAAAADVVFLALPWKHLKDAVSGLPEWNGRIVIDAMNPIITPEFIVADLGGRTSSEVVAELVPGARVVKGFNTLTPAVLGSDPQIAGGRRVIFISGDDAAAKAEVTRINDKVGFATVDLGGLADGGKLHQFPGGPLPALNLIKLS
ncbi:putative dinucleotide-binding enzyme [Paenibacillus forsythiae]|uniref:Dinucleotide-binding enzyme n=1 Tax=Paenibacillus forsythiae TaxID=365616 RepID=A0ABU3HC89_9BACL|nr:NAD(P)-binding domain-containing protein [Paenibacillus forsythiae]MDT3428438.1 putative dinucleotide-binding enzyme [Paenibacillus forsythiae]